MCGTVIEAWDEVEGQELRGALDWKLCCRGVRSVADADPWTVHEDAETALFTVGGGCQRQILGYVLL